MDVRQLHYFIAVAEELHFTRAAARCGVSQPPFSRQIALLEAHLGAPLLARSRHSVQLTDIGRAFLEDARRAVAAVAHAETEARRFARGARGRIRLGFGGSAAYALLPALLKNFRGDHPDVEIIFRSMPVSAQIEALRTREIDVGLLRLPVHDEMLATRWVYAEPLIVAASDAMAVRLGLRATGAIRLQDLADAPFVAYEPRRGFGYYADLLSLCAAAGFRPRIAHEAPTTEALVGMVACGEGVALAPASAQRLTMAGVRFASLAPPQHAPPELIEVRFAIAWRKLETAPAIQHFIEAAGSFASTNGRPRPHS